MTVVATPPSFANINRPAWGSGSNGSINHDDVRGMFAPRKSIPRTNSSSSLASNSSASSTSSTSTLVSSNGSINGGPVGGTAGTTTPLGDSNGFPITTLRKRPPQKAQWSANRSAEGPSDFGRGPAPGNPPSAAVNGLSALHQMSPYSTNHNQMQNGANGANSVMGRSLSGEPLNPQTQPVLYLVSLNGTFDRKTITVPYHPDTLRIGRQTNKSTTPTTVNGFFDSKVLSRQHAEIWADRATGKIYIRDIKSSNGTFVNNTRLSAENRESEPHELQTNDQLELGIDIVSEDQKSVVHHKVAARVEHAGFINPSSLFEININELDPTNNPMMAAQMNGMQYHGRPGMQQQVAAGRMAPSANMGAQANGAALSRNLWLTGPYTEAIVKKIHQEMRNAKQQSNDLLRTQEFLKALLSKDDIRNDGNAKRDEAANANANTNASTNARPPMNGNSVAFRGDAKARFTDPPAPPPQQPLPEKPDVPSLKRNAERPKSGSYNANSSPSRPEIAAGQVNQLTDALKTAKIELDTQHSRLRELEDKLHQEQEARKSAEDTARRLEEAASVQHMNGSASTAVTALEEAFEPPSSEPVESKAQPEGEAEVETEIEAEAEADKADTVVVNEAAAFKARLDVLMLEMEGMRKQLEEYRRRAETAEAERDADRETLAQMVARIRERDEKEAKRAAAAAIAAAAAEAAEAAEAAALTAVGGTQVGQFAQALSRSLSRGRKRTEMNGMNGMNGMSGLKGMNGMNGINGINMSLDGEAAAAAAAMPMDKGGRGAESAEQTSREVDASAEEEKPTLSRMTTITPATSSALAKTSRERVLVQSVPYASMVGVVLLGMGLMAYLNGWQAQTPRLER